MLDEMHSRDTTILIILVTVVYMTTPVCLSTLFYPSTIVPTLVENSFLYASLLPFLQIIIIIIILSGEHQGQKPPFTVGVNWQYVEDYNKL